MSEIGTIEVVFLLLLLFIVGLGLLARKMGTPYPIVMVLGGLVLGFVPGIPQFNLNPELIFLVILPPLLYASAWTTSWHDFTFNLVSILMLAFGLVGFTVLGVALIAPLLLTGFDWRLGVVLGAIVAPTDAIAATSIARRVGLPRRIVDILEGESLINDATGLLALRFGIAIVVEGKVPTVSSGFLTLGWLVAGGVGLGLLVGWIVDFVESRFDDGPIEITLSILVPYAVYLAAEEIHASGVLAVVACGLLLSRRSARLFTPQVRIQIWSFWESFTFMLNGLVFVLIGLQLPAIRDSLSGFDARVLLLDGAGFSLLLILLRLIWIFPASALSYFVRRRLLHQTEQRPEAKQIFVVGWTGMRGVVSLAAALALPAVLANGKAFPQHNFIVFLTFCGILVTLVLQGLTLPLLVRTLGLSGSSGPGCEEREARQLATEAAVAFLEEAKRNDSASVAHVYDDLMLHYRQRLEMLPPGAQGIHRRRIELVRETLKVEHDTVVRLRDEGRINDDVMRRIERELDLSESRFVSVEED